MKQRLWNVLYLIMALTCLATLAGCLGRLWWPLENCGCFKAQCAFVLVCGAIGCWLGKRRNSAIVLAVFTVANATAFVPLYWGRDRLPAASPTFRAMLLNVHTGNRHYAEVIQAIRDNKPDAVVLLEIDGAWASQLQALQDAYPFSILKPRPDNFGIALFSRVRPKEAHTVYAGEADVPSVLARFDIKGRPLTLLGTHPVPPISSEYVHFRNEQLAVLGQLIQAQPGEVLVLGDLNMTSDSPTFGRLLTDAGLRDSRKGFGIQSTWPVGLPFMRIAIDHCLVSPRIAVHNRRVGQAVGSDHLPVIVDVSVRE